MKGFISKALPRYPPPHQAPSFVCDVTAVTKATHCDITAERLLTLAWISKAARLINF